MFTEVSRGTPFVIFLLDLRCPSADATGKRAYRGTLSCHASRARNRPDWRHDPDLEPMTHHGSLGFTWRQLPDPARRIDTELALARFHRALAGLVWDAVALEGNPATFPQVQTLLDGVAVGGLQPSDQDQVLRFGGAFGAVRSLVSSGTFRLDQATSDDLHARAASGGTSDEGELLEPRFAEGTAAISAIPEPYHQALVYCAFATFHRLYTDGTGCTVWVMASGHLMVNGYDAVTVPADRKGEFGRLVDVFRHDADATALLGFLASCSIA